MCLAIVKPVGEVVDETELEAGFLANPDGAGLATIIKGRLQIQKGFFDFDHFYKWYKKSVKKNRPALIHFRLATHGAVDKFNCHPWRIDRDCAMIHNGILAHPSCEVMSDTGHFVRDVIVGNDPFDQEFKSQIQKMIGSRNKFAFLRSDGEFEIYNEDSGFWRDGVWFSNNNHAHLIRDYDDPSDWSDDSHWWPRDYANQDFDDVFADDWRYR